MADILQETSRPQAKRLRTSPEISEAARTSTACDTCRSRKIKCSGTHPCRYCAKRQKECVFPDAGKRKLYSVAYVEELERRVALSREGASGGSEDGRAVSPAGWSAVVENNGQIRGRNSDQGLSATSPLIPDPVMSSSLRFGSHIKALSTDNGPSGTYDTELANVESPDDAYNIVGQHNDTGMQGPELKYPTDEKAQSLLDAVLGSLGMVQHLLDPRTFSDRLASMADVEPGQRPRCLWNVEFLLVFAIGELIQGTIPQDSVIPGARYFQEAVSNLPGFLALRAAGTVGVEIMGLAAFYLQCADCKADAYVYAGMGLRLAVSNGMANGEGGKGLRPSERTHMNRLFWTIYMQERRLAAATGNPFGISDDAIRTSLPYKAPGFHSPEALTVNVRLARITGQITQAIYARRDQSEKEFIRQAQEILTALLETQRSIPPEYTVDFSNQSHTFTRTSATLYLMLLQATMLATRPFLLHAARTRLQHAEVYHNGHTRLTLQAFCAACTEAAWKTLQILQGLRKQQIIAKFGFFDLDALFSAAFVFVLSEKITPRGPTEPSGIRGAASLMDWLSTCDNKVATKRLADIHQMCSHLGISVNWQGLAITPTPAAQGGSEDGTAPGSLPVGMASPGVQGVVPAWQSSEQGQDLGLDMLSFSPGEVDIAAFWDGGGLSLDGTFETDWQEFERITSQF